MDKQRSTDGVIHDKRSERRYPTNDAVEVIAYPYNGTPVPAKIIDVSRSGMKVELPTPFARGTRIEVLMVSSALAVFGEVRYCRESGPVYQLGMLIEDVVQPKPDTRHLNEDDISLYIVGKGLSAAEVLRIEDHLSKCVPCKLRVTKITKMLYPGQRRFE